MAGKTGVRTHQLLLAILGAAEFTRSRRAVVREIWATAAKLGDYANSVEELTLVRGDPIAALPVLAAAVLTFAWPPAGRLFERAAVGWYALTPAAWAQIVASANDAAVGERSPSRRSGRVPARFGS
jgi:hypothetical protein